MKRINMGNSGMVASAIAIGCMRMAQMSLKDMAFLTEKALELGIDLFDHADIYGDGQSEAIFGRMLSEKPSLRQMMFLQSKCGIRSGWYDNSKYHILQSVDGILQRLNTDYIDLLMLHRPDTLMEPEEIAEAFDILHSAGKVRHFGVSNMNPAQMELISSCLKHKLIVNQLQFSAAHTEIIDSGIYVNLHNNSSGCYSMGVLEYCRLKQITIQAWSPLQYGFFEGTFLGNEKYAKLNKVLNRIANEKNCTPAAAAVAWILRHPANMQAVIGSANIKHIEEIAKAAYVEISRQEWYEIYRAAGNQLP